MEQKTGIKLKFYHAIYIPVLFLSLFGVIASYSISGELLSSVMQMGIGLVIIFLVSKIRYQRINQWADLSLLLGFILLLITLFFGEGGGGRSLRIGNIQFQTFYAIAILTILYLATFLARVCERKKPNEPYLSKYTARYVLAIILIFTALMAIRNISTAILFFCTSMAITFIAGIRFKTLLLFILICAIGGAGYVYLGSLRNSAAQSEQVVSTDDERVGDRSTTASNRIKYWLTGETETVGYGKQMTLSKAAIARSLTHATGPGKGMMKKSMAEGDNDYIFALICEEMSTLAGIFIILLYTILFYQAILIAQKAKGNAEKKTHGYFIKFFATGIGVMIFGQAIIHIGANVGVIPATGQTLPFISRGLTTLVITCGMTGILINMGRQVDEKTIDHDEDLSV